MLTKNLDLNRNNRLTLGFLRVFLAFLVLDVLQEANSFLGDFHIGGDLFFNISFSLFF